MNFLKILVFALVLGIASGVAQAQIIIRAQDCYGPGTSLTELNADGVSFNTGSGGANQTWSLSTYTWDDSTHYSVVAPAGTPFADTFPTATRAYGLVDDAFTLWAYERIAADAYQLLGMGFIMEGTPIPAVANPVSLMAPLPLQMGATWTSVLHLIVMGQSMAYDSSIRTVDGWGTINTPFGSHAVLRIFQREWEILNGELDASYVWINQQGIPIVSMSSSTGTQDPNFNFGDVNVVTPGTVPAEPVRGPVAERFLVGQNYPNPFNPNTTLPVEIARQSHLELSIYDETGRLVSTQTFELPAGQHSLPIDGTGWATGTYFARVQTEGAAQTTKMQLVK